VHSTRSLTLFYTFLHYYTLLYTIIHYYTLWYTVVHYYTLLYTIIHYYTLLYTIVHCPVGGKLVFGWCGEAHWLQRWIKKGEIDEKASDFLFSTNKSSLLRKLQEAESRKKK